MRKNPAIKILLIVFAGALVVILVLVGWLRPFAQSVSSTQTMTGVRLNSTGLALGDWFRAFGQAKSLAKRNQQLEQEVSELKQELAQAQEINSANQQLAVELKQDQSFGRKFVAAQVVAYQPDSFRQYLTINRGAKEGIAVGQAVIERGGLVGRIDSTSLHSAKVFLLSDPNFKISAIDQVTRASGTAHGQIGAGLVLEKVAQSDILHEKDAVITSGLGGDVPAGLLIGTIEQVRPDQNGVFQLARIISAVKFDHLTMVLVVTEP